MEGFSLFMKQYYHIIVWSVEKNTESKNPKVARTKNGKIMLLSNCVISDSKKSKFLKHQEAGGLLSRFRIKAPLSKIPLVGPLLF